MSETFYNEMKPNAKKISVVRELHEIIIVRRQNQIRLFCRDCREDADFLSLDEAVGFSGFGTREILELVDGRKVHALDAPNGQMLVCAKSLVQEENLSTKKHEGNTKKTLV